MGTWGLGARLCKHNDSVRTASFIPRPLSRAAVAQSRDVPLGCPTTGLDASVRGDFASREGKSRLGRELAVAPEVAGACGRVEGHSPGAPIAQPCEETGAAHRAEGEPGGRTAVGTPVTPAPVTIGLAEGTGAVPGSVRCRRHPRHRAPRASRRRHRGSPSPPAFVSRGAHGKWESAPHSFSIPAKAKKTSTPGPDWARAALPTCPPLLSVG